MFGKLLWEVRCLVSSSGGAGGGSMLEELRYRGRFQRSFSGGSGIW